MTKAGQDIQGDIDARLLQSRCGGSAFLDRHHPVAVTVDERGILAPVDGAIGAGDARRRGEGGHRRTRQRPEATASRAMIEACEEPTRASRSVGLVKPCAAMIPAMV
ncbi:hypothetical protein [Pseudogemmobacter sonorensis]|uniref:hypothetical protein n=1 Tax=Pseudogemmobacter sonorensis TaxID=2989681 RepID=UPI0036B3D176